MPPWLWARMISWFFGQDAHCTCGQVVVYNDDAASGEDSKENDKLMDKLLDILPCRLAGGFTTNERVYDWLDKGASQIVVDYAASNLGFLDGVPKVRLRRSQWPHHLRNVHVHYSFCGHARARALMAVAAVSDCWFYRSGFRLR